jgi:hypothetical protein
VLELTLLDATGHVVRTEHLVHPAAVIQRQELEVSALPSGLYELRLTAPDGARGTRRLMIE